MHFIKKTELMQVDQLLELGVNVTIYNGQVLTVRSPETIHTMSACFFITPGPLPSKE
jgi:demethoxyubiquinone hydroxylase (CLK1/Coq7/Cat5 family)